MTPQEQAVAFQRQALENGQASLQDRQRALAEAQAAGASPAELAELQQNIENQVRANSITQEGLDDALAKLNGTAVDAPSTSREATEANANLANNPSGDVQFPNTQAFDDGSTLETFEDGSTLATDSDGNITSSPPPDFAPLNAPENPVNPVPIIGVPIDDETGELNPGWAQNEETGEYFYRGNGIDAGAQTGSDASDESVSGDADAQPGGFYGRDPKIPYGATKSPGPGAEAQWSDAKDLRVKLRVPNEYLSGPSAGPANILQKNGGILFPYTPAITVENQASYANQNPLHSNYPLYFYKSSTVTPITVSAKFTVQNEFEGAVLLGVIHLLRSLTKMKFGNDPDAGSPPPVCRFDAYGDYMLFNVPVSVASWRHELPDSVDYIAVGRPGSPTTYGRSMVPVMSTITLTLNVMYSRREMLAYNTKSWLSGSLRRRGYL